MIDKKNTKGRKKEQRRVPADKAEDRNTMYYKDEHDRALMRDSDQGLEDSADPMASDGYGAEDDADENDPFSLPGEGRTPNPEGRATMKRSLPGLAGKLRRRGPQGGY